MIPQGDWQRLDRGFRFRIPGWGSVPWKKVITELSLIGYDYVMSYEHEDVTMSRNDGITKTIAYLKPLLIEKPYEGRHRRVVQLNLVYAKRSDAMANMMKAAVFEAVRSDQSQRSARPGDRRR